MLRAFFSLCIWWLLLLALGGPYAETETKLGLTARKTSTIHTILFLQPYHLIFQKQTHILAFFVIVSNLYFDLFMLIISYTTIGKLPSSVLLTILEILTNILTIGLEIKLSLCFVSSITIWNQAFFYDCFEIE